MTLKELDFEYSYRSNYRENQIHFYNKCLKVSKNYDRAVGYFSSDVFTILSEGLNVFIENEGTIRMVVNPELKKEDLDAIEIGLKSREQVVEQCLLRELSKKLDENQIESLALLSWLVSINKLHFRVAFSNEYRLYHEKFGIFTDFNMNQVAFSGSANESVGGLIANFEKIDVYTEDREKARVDLMRQDFEMLWNDDTQGLDVLPFSPIVMEKLMSYNKNSSNLLPKKGVIPDIKLRDYQSEAIQALISNGWCGILEMATGTGKTITSIFASLEYLKLKKRGLIVILVPFVHLADQWYSEVKNVTQKNSIICRGNRNDWREPLTKAIRNLNAGITDSEYVIAVYKTSASDQFHNIVSKIKTNSLLIADECHNFGAPHIKKKDFSFFSNRIGLSATPDRWFDEEGTRYIKDYFKEVVFEYDLDKAISKGKLTPYLYNPIIIRPSTEEIEEYRNISRRIGIEYGEKNRDTELIKRLLRKRSNIISKSEDKIPTLISMLKLETADRLSHILVYCSPGEIEIITKQISNCGIRVHKFNHEVPMQERTRILDLFDSGEIQILVAINCLDEGVDIPSTRTAYFLASTSNPRQFIQRRGRILRKYKDKEFAEIYDFVVLPENTTYEIYKDFASKELPRVTEFLKSASNSSAAKNILFEELLEYDLNNLLYKDPWDVYRERQETNEYDNQGTTN